jgi:dihydrofolate synthase/folylpolyglutamate synthase
MDAIELKQEAGKYQLLGNSFTSVEKALQEAKKQAKIEDLIFIGGSTFVVAEVV